MRACWIEEAGPIYGLPVRISLNSRSRCLAAGCGTTRRVWISRFENAVLATARSAAPLPVPAAARKALVMRHFYSSCTSSRALRQTSGLSAGDFQLPAVLDRGFRSTCQRCCCCEQSGAPKWMANQLVTSWSRLVSPGVACVVIEAPLAVARAYAQCQPMRLCSTRNNKESK